MSRQQTQSWEDDARLAARYTDEADTRALETLFRRHLEATYAFARRFLSTREDAEEAASETWLRAGRALRAGRFRGESRFKTWLLGIARLVCLERLRQPVPTLSGAKAASRPGCWASPVWSAWSGCVSRASPPCRCQA